MAVLVTYSTRSNSTEGVAQAIYSALWDKGIAAEIHPMSEVSDLSSYEAIFLGSAIQSAKWLPEAVAFVTNRQGQLSSKPIALFTVCMTMAMRNALTYRPQVLEWVKPIRLMTNPKAEEVFAGALEIRKIPGFFTRLRFRLSVLFGVWKEGDHRDWARIRQWTHEAIQKLGLIP